MAEILESVLDQLRFESVRVHDLRQLVKQYKTVLEVKRVTGLRKPELVELVKILLAVSVEAIMDTYSIEPTEEDEF